MAFLRDFLVAKEGEAKEGGVLQCPASESLGKYRVTKVDEDGPFWVPWYSFASQPYHACVK